LSREPTADRPRGNERGSLAVELAIVAPALLAVLALVLSYGRFGQVTALLDMAARDGARAASQARSLDDAQQRVSDITEEAMESAPASCRDSAVGDVVGDVFEPGDNVTVEVRCTVTFSDLGAWGTPGDTTVVRRFASPLDPNRGVR
jgi:Flp pilus assembly protein TadG